MRIVLDWGEYSQTLVVEDLLHSLKRQPSQIPLPAVWNDAGVLESPVFMFDIGNCVEIIILRGKTNEIEGPTKTDLDDMIRTWGYDLSPTDLSSQIRLWVSAERFFYGSFGKASFTHEAGQQAAQDFSIEFRIAEKGSGVAGENFWLHVTMGKADPAKSACEEVYVNDVRLTLRARVVCVLSTTGRATLAILTPVIRLCGWTRIRLWSCTGGRMRSRCRSRMSR